MHAIEKSASGWDVFIKNDWTTWAEKKGIILGKQSLSAIRHREPRSIALGKEPRLLDSKVLKFNDKLKNWKDDAISPTSSITVSEYKHLFNGKRPWWALTFTERRLRHGESIVFGRYKVKYYIPPDSPSYNRYQWIEKEVIKFPPKGIKNKVVIERLLSPSGNCVRVTRIMLFNKGGPLSMIQEDKISKQVWAKTWSGTIPEDTHAIKYQTLLSMSTPWSDNFNL
jgi:hypothetical protein